MKEDRHIYMFTAAGWQHLGTGKIVQPGGIPLDTEDVQGLKELYLQAEDPDAAADTTKGKSNRRQNADDDR